ncbi:hypothetical protein PI125_g19005 [Phytophthora idaei]|nr:hypothetical protein PI125_g19005 [Phytophthora idaei]
MLRGDFREDADEEESEEEDDSTKDKEELPDYLRNVLWNGMSSKLRLC